MGGGDAAERGRGGAGGGRWYGVRRHALAAGASGRELNHPEAGRGLQFSAIGCFLLLLFRQQSFGVSCCWLLLCVGFLLVSPLVPSLGAICVTVRAGSSVLMVS